MKVLNYSHVDVKFKHYKKYFLNSEFVDRFGQSNKRQLIKYPPGSPNPYLLGCHDHYPYPSYRDFQGQHIPVCRKMRNKPHQLLAGNLIEYPQSAIAHQRAQRYLSSHPILRKNH